MRLSLLIFLFVWAVSLKAQVNLVPNPSFEICSPCPDNVDQVIRATGWDRVRETPEYFNACAGPTNNFIYVPTNQNGYQYAATGNAYCGFAVSFTANPHGNRETIGAQLLSDLVIGEKYLVSVKFCLANDSNPTRTACNNMGVKFSTVPYSLNNPVPIDNISQVYAASIISDSVNWTEVTGSFIADSSYRYINVCNFFDNAHTDTINLMSVLPGVAYYYVDDVSVTLDTTTGIPETEKPKLKIFPNPAGSQITIEQLSVTGNQLSVEVYDAVGRLVLQSSINNQTSTIPLNLSKGVYLLRVKEKEEVVFWEKLIIE